MAKALAATAVALTLTACTPTEVSDAFQRVGVTITDHEADIVSKWINEQDCLPWEDQPQYLECGITDSWAKHLRHSGITIEQWSRIAWCESRLNPDARNTSSGAAGLFQHLPRYWPARAAASGYPSDVFNPRTNAFVSAWLVETSGVQHWAASRGCWN